MNIYVGNLSWSMSDDDLSNLFTQFGSVTSAKILKDKVSGRSKGFGFVEMETDEEANNAIANLNETEIQGRKIIVNQSQPRPAGEGGGGGFKKRSGGFGGGNRGGGSGGGYGGGGNRGGYGGGRESGDY
ncbi:MAG: RNA-binding protein [Chitinophagaceae bacterium]|nr:RNA-binding protein [Chitinophagaceae bacterium]